MICEFALEPSLLNNWPSFRYFVGSFGMSQGRLISRYPKRWKRLVYEALVNCGDIERKRIEEGLSRIDDRLIKRPNSLWTDGQQWLPNAEAEHYRRPFHAIIASSNPNGHAFVLDGNALDDANPTWCVRRAEVVQREAAAMANIIAPLLRSSQQLIFIDPHFDPQRIEYRNPLERSLALALQEREVGPIQTVEIHTSDAYDNPSTQVFQERCQRFLPAIIPTGMRVHIYRWRQRDGGEKLHNRYVLTELGGVQFHVGLDEGNPGETDEVDLLEEKVYVFRMLQYDPKAPAFDPADDIMIQGTKR